MLGLADHLSDQFETTLLSFSEGGQCRELLKHASDRGYLAEELNNDTPWFRSAIRELTVRLKSHDTSVLCCHGYKASILGRIAARRVGIPVLAVSRGWTAETWKVRVYEKLDRWNLRWMDRIVCVSRAQTVKAHQGGAPFDKTVTIPNAVDPRRFQHHSPQSRGKLAGLFSRNPKFIIASAGRLSPEKGVEVFLRSAIDLVSQDHTLGFVHFGEGKLRSKLEMQIPEPLRGQIVLSGYRQDLDALLPHCNAFVLSSYTEGMPNVILEAHCARVPTIATKVGGTPELIRDRETGLLINPGSSQELTSAIRTLLNSAPLQKALASRGRENVLKHFTFTSQARAYESLFVELTESVNSPEHSTQELQPTA